MEVCLLRSSARATTFVNRGLRDTHATLGGFYVPENEHHDSSITIRLLSPPIWRGGRFGGINPMIASMVNPYLGSRFRSRIRW